MDSPAPEAEADRPAGVLEATCLCGACQLRGEGPILFSSVCHCSMCQRWTGAPFTHYVGFPSGKLRCVQGEDKLSEYKSSPTLSRYACSACGTRLMNESHDKGYRDMPAGVLERDAEGRILGVGRALAPRLHIFYGSRQADVQDELPKLKERVGSALLDSRGQELVGTAAEQAAAALQAATAELVATQAAGSTT